MKSTAKNCIVVGQKIDPWRCALVPVMGKPIPIGLVINLRKNHTNRTVQTPTYDYVTPLNPDPKKEKEKKSFTISKSCQYE